ncbi:hypothetical protein FNV43_RR00490 [Rhamnella rubrinervis]|uniref:starch synthase n=1 Tax=Rhamnella rubrinervis TaxID=2594499 RepID=A0A8K0HQQ3_9ROSA|nr:hypothetical protein FNV43_RR00490 [Rhamnella rubrinervis]
MMDRITLCVVPPKSGYVQGFGPGPKPISRTLRLSEQRRKEAEDRAKSAEERNEELTKQIEELKARQDRIEDSLFQRIRVDVQAHFQQERLNVDTPSWMHGETFNGQNSANDVQGKTENKEAIRRDLGLSSADVRKPLVGCITRLVPQKGVHLIRHAIYRTLELGGQFVLFGSSPVPDSQLKLVYDKVLLLIWTCRDNSTEIQRGANAEGVKQVFGSSMGKLDLILKVEVDEVRTELAKQVASHMDWLASHMD